MAPIASEIVSWSARRFHGLRRKSTATRAPGFSPVVLGYDGAPGLPDGHSLGHRPRRIACVRGVGPSRWSCRPDLADL